MTSVTAIKPRVGGILADLLDVLGRTGDAMLAIDGEFSIIAWNGAATELLGYSPDEVLGRPCHEVLCWRDRCGNAVCDGRCPAAAVGEPAEAIETREVLGHSAGGETLWLSASTITPPVELREQCRLVHLVREVAVPLELERVIVERLRGWSPATGGEDGRPGVVTQRERGGVEPLAGGGGGGAASGGGGPSPAAGRSACVFR